MPKQDFFGIRKVGIYEEFTEAENFESLKKLIDERDYDRFVVRITHKRNRLDVVMASSVYFSAGIGGHHPSLASIKRQCENA
ncbi:hypothetical protein [Vibrio alfacsensis]|uniref:hypothetical protein n=1 Tax=Vibrio alfacsensis TaxID=1074311 RepID=UPI001BF0E6CF|nr:hypothetical protein [Vibrio alfacsensis]BCN26788.1 hypothetical protein VYA_39800 [Vibrio alfacsensis]